MDDNIDLGNLPRSGKGMLYCAFAHVTYGSIRIVACGEGRRGRFDLYVHLEAHGYECYKERNAIRWSSVRACIAGWHDEVRNNPLAIALHAILSQAPAVTEYVATHRGGTVPLRDRIAALQLRPVVIFCFKARRANVEVRLEKHGEGYEVAVAGSDKRGNLIRLLFVAKDPLTMVLRVLDPPVDFEKIGTRYSYSITYTTND